VTVGGRAILPVVTKPQSFDRWYVLQSADAMAFRSYTTDEIVQAWEQGVFKDRTVIYDRYGSRRDAITVKDLIDRTRKK
jgi:hypothetical protein